MKIAVIGAGQFGINHVRTLRDLNALGPVAEPSPSRHNAILEISPEIEILTNAECLRQRPDIEAVVIATPAPTHYGIAKGLLEAGKDVLVEKPMTLSVADAEDLHHTAIQGGRVLMTGHLLIYHPAIVHIKQAIAAGRIGTLFTLHQERAKLGRVRHSEDALWSLGVHDIAVLLHLVGTAPDYVSRFGHAGLQPNIADDVYLHLHFPGGVKATLHNSWLWPEDSRVLRIIGSEGMIEYREQQQTVTLHRKWADSQGQHHDEGGEILFQGSAQPLRLELEHFIACVKTRATPLSDGLNGVNVIRVLEQAFVA